MASNYTRLAWTVREHLRQQTEAVRATQGAQLHCTAQQQMDCVARLAAASMQCS
jgi:hypothetical protein